MATQIRSCVACRGRESSKELLHLVLIEGRVTPDPKRVLPGRGAWLHPNCFELAVQRRSFGRAFKSSREILTEDLESYLQISLNHD